MNNKISPLEKIREQFRNKETTESNQGCPHCGHELTIERTNFYDSRACQNCFEYWQVNNIEGACCRAPALHMVKMIIAGGGVQIRNQCQNCGFITPNSIGGIPALERDKIPLADLALKEKCYDRQWDMKRKSGVRVADGKAAKRKKDWMLQYNKYLQSPAWREKRELVLKRDNYLCQACLSALATQVHHRSYEFVDLAGNEPAFDLVAICTPCHEKVEEMKRERSKYHNNL